MHLNRYPSTTACVIDFAVARSSSVFDAAVSDRVVGVGVGVGDGAIAVGGNGSVTIVIVVGSDKRSSVGDDSPAVVVAALVVLVAVLVVV